MNIHNNLILVKGVDKTQEIESCKYDKSNNKYKIIFNKSTQEYPYASSCIKWLKNPKNIDVNSVRISRNGTVFFDIQEISEFEGYYRIFFGNGKISLYKKCELVIEKNSLQNKDASNCFEYFKVIANEIGIRNDDDKSILSGQYEKIEFISHNSALSTYLQPESKQLKNSSSHALYFPFGCNLSQMQAVQNAFSNKISIIEGPPGTGKTQTILNIIANAIINGKTVAVVSNNNSATDNVLEKLEKNGLEFITAPLGNSKNKKAFINNQTKYPAFNKYKYDADEISSISNKTIALQNELKEMLTVQNSIADLKRQLSAIKLEKKYFNEYCKEAYDEKITIRNFEIHNSAQMLKLWIECEAFSERQKSISLWFKLKSIFFYGISDIAFLKRPIEDIICAFQNMYYIFKVYELEKVIKDTEEKLKSYNFKEKLFEMTDKSMAYFKHSLYEKYEGRTERPIFMDADLWKASNRFNAEYPIILSTTHSLRNCLNKDYMYDYVIVDESSQVDLITGGLTLSCARNIVVVGDLMQLPNVIAEDDKKKIQPISDSFHIKDGYKYESNSLLSSICTIIPNVSRTLLKEHYRCHPKIIEFCNQKFYNNELVIMTSDNHEKDVLKVYKTISGNHARGHYNQRQIDEIKLAVIPELQNGNEAADIGIIAPYRKQTEAIQKDLLSDLDVSTVHKFQGREKDDIIISTVDNEITEFTDNSNMLNVAVSRAKNRLRLVISDNEKNDNTNIGDLVKFIQYNNFEVVDGDVYSVFDLLYSDYTKQRNKYLMKHKRVSEFDSENLMYALVKDVLEREEFKKLDVVIHQPLNMLIRNHQKLSDDECKYAMNCATHLDFLIYNKLDKVPFLAIEVDGYDFHKAGTRQAERDKMKDEILKKYNIPILRFKTNGSQEKEILEGKIVELLLM